MVRKDVSAPVITGQRGIQAGGLDTLEIFTMPVLLGEGVPLWLPSAANEVAKLVESVAMELGVVRSVYRF